jgi:hypothetical protein
VCSPYLQKLLEKEAIKGENLPFYLEPIFKQLEQMIYQSNNDRITGNEEIEFAAKLALSKLPALFPYLQHI